MTRSARRFLEAVAAPWDTPEPWQATAKNGLAVFDADALREMCDEVNEDYETAADEVLAAVRQKVAEDVGRRIGKAMAKDVLAEGMPREWTGLDAQDGDQAMAAGLHPETAEWDEMKRAAKAAYLHAVQGF